MDKITNSIEETYLFAQEFVNKYISDKGVTSKIICLQGDLGAGKTTFTQGVLKAFDAIGPYTSPTFNIVKEYDVDKYDIKKIYHIDAYRITSEDVESIGWNEIISNESNLVIIEWPENISDVLPQDKIVISCQVISEMQRKYIIQQHKNID